MATVVSPGMSAWFSLEGQDLYDRHSGNQTDKSPFCCLGLRVWVRFNHLGLECYNGFETAGEAAVGTETILGCSFFSELCKASWHFQALLPLAGSWKCHGSSAGGGELLTYFSAKFLGGAFFFFFYLVCFFQNSFPVKAFRLRMSWCMRSTTHRLYHGLFQ